MGRHPRSLFLNHRRPAVAAALAVVLASAAFAPARAAVAAGVGPLRTVTSDANQLRVTVGSLQADWQTLSGPQAGRYALRLDGFGQGGEPGHPLLPVAAGWILVPPGTRPELHVVSEAWEAAGGRALALAPVPVTRATADGSELVEVTLLPGQALPADLQTTPAVQEALGRATASRGGAAAELGEVAWWRGRRVVPLQVIPVRHDGAGNATALLAEGTWEVRFVPQRQGAADMPELARRRLTTVNDEFFGPAFLNADLLRRAPSEAAWRGGQPVRSPGASKSSGAATLLAPEVRIAVRSTRLLRVSYARLRERGLLPDVPIQESEVRLYQRRYDPALDDGSGNPPWLEIEVPIRMVGDGDAFDGDDFFVFYGLRLRDDTDYQADLGDGLRTVPGCGDNGEWANDANVYWFAAAAPAAGEAWARMATTTLPAAVGTPLPNYRRTDHLEEQLILRENVASTLSDRLYQNIHFDSNVSVNFSSQWAPDPAGAAARIEVAAAAYANAPPSIVRRVRFDLTIDDTPSLLGVVDLRYVNDTVYGWDVPAATLSGAFAKVTMTKIEPVGALFSFVNWVRVTYDAQYRATGQSGGTRNQAFHSGDQAGPRPIAVTGFNDGDLGLVEITDPRRPVWVALAPQNVVVETGGATLSIMPTQMAAGQPRRFWATDAFAADGVGEFAYYESSAAVDPVDPTRPAGPDPDLVVITHGELRAGLDRWLEHRRARAGGDLAAQVVDVRDLYDWYGGGLKSNWAIKRFVNHAVARWGSWALVIVGDANENQRELAVRADAREWATDWVPTHYHVQNALAGEYEFMASDKWYVTDETGDTDATDNYPDRIRSPWSMLLGRLPCNSPAELDRLVNKIIQVETPAEGQEWRRRGVFFADDAFSNGYGAEALSILEYRPGEEQFGWSERDTLAAWWGGGTPVTLDDQLLLLDDWLGPRYPGTGDRSVDAVRLDTETYATPPLLAALSGGGLVAHYQGHANAYVLSSEYWVADRAGRRDLGNLANGGKPFVFFGMGCHISDWAQSTVKSRTASDEPSLGEKILIRTDAGGVASYASPGYEYITENRLFGERIFRVWTKRPPVVPGHGGSARSRWMLGELLWAAEAEHLAILFGDFIHREMVAQYTLLGDPLMVLDAGPPQVTAVLKGNPDQEVTGTAPLVALDPGNLRTLAVTARDEAGIDRLRVVDSRGADLTDQVVVMSDSLPPGQSDHQEVHYRLQVPVRPYAHSIEVGVWDTGGALAEDRHWTLTLEVGQEVEFQAGGAVVDPSEFAFVPEVPVDFAAAVSGGTWFHEGTTWALASDNLGLTNVVLPTGKTNTAQLSFTATAPDDSLLERSVVLTIDGNPTEWVLQAGPNASSPTTISRVYNFPNPMRDRTRFLFETDAEGGEGVIRVFSTSGRVVARIPFRLGGVGPGVVEWTGRDDEGDELANGTYLYRVEMDAPDGHVTSPVQRLVVMR